MYLGSAKTEEIRIPNSNEMFYLFHFLINVRFTVENAYLFVFEDWNTCLL